MSEPDRPNPDELLAQVNREVAAAYEQMIKTNHSGQDDAKFVVMTFPMVLRDQRATAMVSNRIPNGSMISQLGSTAVTLEVETIPIGPIADDQSTEVASPLARGNFIRAGIPRRTSGTHYPRLGLF